MATGIILPGRTHEHYSYPDIKVSRGLSYLPINYDDAEERVHARSGLMLTIRQFVDFLNLLRSGKAYDANGKRIGKAELNRIYEGITTSVRNPWHAEHLDARFSLREDTPNLSDRPRLSITYHSIQPNGSLKEVTEPLVDCLMEDRLPGISLDDWLKNANSQGLPRPGLKEGDSCYSHPKTGKVASFVVYLGMAGLGCNGSPQVSGPGYGVRFARPIRTVA